MNEIYDYLKKSEVNKILLIHIYYLPKEKLSSQWKNDWILKRHYNQNESNTSGLANRCSSEV